jgi:hypothetical protein
MPAVEYCTKKQLPIYLCAVDVDKAYDSINRSALKQVIDHIGIGDSILW